MNLDDPPPSSVYVSTAKEMLNMPWVMTTILAQTFGEWRTPELIACSIKNSLCFGLYERQPQDPAGPSVPDLQIGFARVVTDFSTHGWLCDFVIMGSKRRQGNGRFLMQEIISYPSLENVLLELRTRDRQFFYSHFGFEPVVAWRRIPR